jgi:hypothetical protein
MVSAAGGLSWVGHALFSAAMTILIPRSLAVLGLAVNTKSGPTNNGLVLMVRWILELTPLFQSI